MEILLISLLPFSCFQFLASSSLLADSRLYPDMDLANASRSAIDEVQCGQGLVSATNRGQFYLHHRVRPFSAPKTIRREISRVMQIMFLKGTAGV